MKSFRWIIASLLGLTILLSGCATLARFNPQGKETESAPQITPAPTPTPVTTISPQTRDALETIQQGFTAIYNQVAPSVVNIQVVKNVPAGPSGFPFSAPGGERRQSGLGSGFVWDDQGHIVTNNHVVEGADQITVTFWDGTSAEATLVGNDPNSDLAVVQVDVPVERLHPIQVADSTQVQVGQLVAAIGNPFGLEGTMTTGIISALGRSLPVGMGSAQGATYTIPDVIQTDAPINPGNSGGVLVNMNGQLIGVTTAIESPVRASAGIGFVVPSIIVQRVVPDLIANGRYEHPFIGISGTTLNASLAQAMNLDADQRGVLVVEVIPNSPADEAGLRGSDRLTEINGQQARIGGDVILQIDDYAVNDFEDLTAYLARYTSAGQTITLTVLRQGKTETIKLTLGVRPTDATMNQTGARSGEGAWLGILGSDLNPDVAEAMNLDRDQKGVLVQQVLDGSPADQAGLRGSYKSATINGQSILIGGDVIIGLDQEEITNMERLQALLNTYSPGEKVTLTIMRDGQQREVVVQLGERP